MRQWRQMRQMRHFFLRFGISSLVWQKPSPPSKNAKSVAFCQTDDPGSAGRPCASFRASSARFSLPLDGGKTGTPDLIRPGLVELPCNPSPIPLRSSLAASGLPSCARRGPDPRAPDGRCRLSGLMTFVPENLTKRHNCCHGVSHMDQETHVLSGVSSAQPSPVVA